MPDASPTLSVSQLKDISVIEFTNNKILDEANIASIARVQLKELERRVRAMEMDIEVSDAAVAELAKAGFDPVYGARTNARAGPPTPGKFISSPPAADPNKSGSWTPTARAPA